jgi:hypothetical protein
MGMSDFWIGAYEKAFDDFTDHLDITILESDLKALGLDDAEIEGDLEEARAILKAEESE